MIERDRAKRAAKRKTKSEREERGYKPPVQVTLLQKLDRGVSLALVLSYGGCKTFRVVTYVNGKPQSYKLGTYPQMSLAEAKKKANEYHHNPKKIRADDAVGTFKDVAEQWFRRHVEEDGLRSKHNLRAHLDKYIYPAWANRDFLEIRRSEVNTLLDTIADDYGRSQADAVLATIRNIMNWYQTRHENFTSPIVKGMKRDPRKGSERARKRVLNDNEIRAVWEAASQNGTLGPLIKLLLLTAQRRDKVAKMQWNDLDLTTGVWTIRTEKGEKGNAGSLKLPDRALAILGKQPRIAGNPHVFAGRGKVAFNSYSQRKAEFESLLPEMPRWTLHDLRRTARSLLSRAGVRPDISERVLGHVIPGVEGVYDRHQYDAEKTDALGKLAALIDSIVNPPEGNVVALRR